MDIQVAPGVVDSYLHMTNIQVEDGDIVEPGDRLGQVSDQTLTTRHLHFERRMAAAGHTFTPVSPYIALVDAYRKIVGRIAPTYRVRATADVTVHSNPAGAIIGSKTAGSTGIVIGNTQEANYQGYCYIWKQIQWDDGTTGYSQDNFLVAVAPNVLAQADYNGSIMSVGATTNAGAVTIQGHVTSPEARSVALEIELRRVNESFTGAKTHESALLASGTTARICVSGLADGNYHWRARARDSANSTTPWRSFGNNSDSSTDFSVASTLCAVCSSLANGETNINITDEKSCGAQLAVDLVASPMSGTAPLNDVDLTATVSGTATGTINYTFYCNRSDTGTNITSGWAAKFDGITTNPKTALNVCDYGSPGTYTAKVIAEHGASAAEDRVTITVTQATAQGPSVTTSGASNVTQGSATLNMAVDPKGSSTNVWFDYDTDTNFCCTTSQQSVGAGTGAILLSQPVGGLSCDTTYFFRARAQSSAGSASGDVLSFRTNTCGGTSQTTQLVADPSFESGNNAWWVASPAFYINRTPTFSNPRTGNYYAFLSTATGSGGNNLEGGMISPQVTIPSNATSAELAFWHSITTQETIASVFDKLEVYIVRPGNLLTLLATISNLDHSGTQYRERRLNVPSSLFGQPVQIFFRGTTDSSLPTVFRVDDVTLKATAPIGGPPSVTTQEADQITSSSVRLNMMINPNGAATTVWFDLEAGDSSPDNDTDSLSIGSDTQNQSVSISAFGLQCNTLYYVRANASNTHGSDAGTVRSFTTGACVGGPPRADTDPAVNVTQTSATLTADVDPNGLSTQAWFAWGASQSLGQETSRISVGSGSGFSPFSQLISGLTCGTDYYFANKALNSAGQDTGATLSFRTTSCDPVELPVVTVVTIDDTATEQPITPGEFLLQRTGNTAGDLSVAYSLGGTAISGVDHTLGEGTVTIPAGSTSTTLPVYPIDDTFVESDETVVVTLQPQSQYTVGNPNSASLTIKSDDVSTECYVNMVSPAGGENWVKAVPQTIRWNAGPGCVDFIFFLRRNGQFDGYITVIEAGTQGTWTPPAWLIPGSTLQIEVTALRADGVGVSAVSNAFSLVNPPVLPPIIFADSVENDTDVEYYYSEGWGVTNFTSHSPTHSRADSPTFYANDVNSSLFTPFLDISGRTSIVLSFWHRFDLADFDSVNVWAKTEFGDWVYLRGFTGQQLDWQPVEIDLGGFVGQPSVQIAFQLLSDESLTADGWYIDDIIVSSGNLIFDDGFETGDASRWLYNE